MASWNTLPPELRRMIADFLRESNRVWNSSKPPDSQLRLVCREWQTLFSHDNFRILVLDQTRLDDFEKLVSCNLPRRQYVKHIILRIKLPEYDCTVCQTSEDFETALRNDIIFMSTLERLFYILSTWVEPRDHPGSGLELDLGAYSPSDGQHGFRDCRFSQEYTYGAGSKVYRLHNITKSTSEDSDTCPGWKRACEGKQPLMPAKRRLLATLGDPSNPHFSHLFDNSGIRFAAAPIVKSLTIRRHYYRHISKEFLGSILSQALTNLLSFRSETWVHPDDHSRGRFQHEHTAVLAALPNTVDRVCLFYQSSRNLRPSMPNDDRFRAWRRDLSHDVATAATKLRSLSACFLVDASDFIAHSNAAALHFPNLQLLVLTSRKLRKREAKASFINSLVSAGNLVFERMPKLAILEIWNVHKDETFFMRFKCTADRTTTVQWFSSWHGDRDLEPLFRKLRARLDAFHPGKQLRASKLEGDEEVWKIRKAHQLILHHESRRQMSIEGGYAKDVPVFPGRVFCWGTPPTTTPFPVL